MGKRKNVFTLNELKKRGIRIINSNGLGLEEKPGGKKRINSSPTSYQGTRYRSKLEVRMAMLLTQLKIPFEYEKKKYIIQEGFESGGEKVRPIKYTPDFTGEGWIVEIKGRPNDQWPLRLKLWKKYMVETGMTEEYHILTTVNEIESFCYKLHNEKNNPPQNKKISS